MSLLFFLVPDLNPNTEGVAGSRLDLHGDQTIEDFVRLCTLLGVPLQHPVSATYPAAYAALSAWQRNHGLMSDGAVGPLMWSLMERTASPASHNKGWLDTLPPERLCVLFPFTLRKNLQIYAPYVLAALDAAGYGPHTPAGHAMCQVALATVRAETEGFAPISEGQSRFNTPPGGAPFSLYDPGTEAGQRLGNTQPGDGERFKGRGFVQLTGRENYTRFGVAIGLELHRLAFLANYPEIGAVLLVQFLKAKEQQLLSALATEDEEKARMLVNGGTHGLDRFCDALARWRKQIAPTLVQARARLAGAANMPVAKRLGRTGFVLPVRRDAVDLRDLPYRPPLRSLPPVWPAQNVIGSFMPLYESLKLVLNQGKEGACTGFGLASVVNYLRFNACATDAARKRLTSVSPRMIYELARRYDEYEGSDYEGSSCRGALKGWHKHGVCFEQDWHYDRDLIPAHPDWASHALQNTLGVYYRIDKSNLVDMQAAIADAGAIFVSTNVHDGWDLPPFRTASGAKLPGHDDLVPIAYVRGQNPRQGAHAFAMVGYNSRGFIVQNSWGPNWGWKGFAVLRYDDWLDNGMDAWVAALGVPGVVNNAAVAARVAPGKPKRARAVKHNRLTWAGVSLPPAELDARHSLVLDRGLVARASTRDTLQPNGLGDLVAEWPRQWFEHWQALHPDEPARLVIYAQGGLNNEQEGLKRARVMARAFLDNGCYPIFIVWKTGLKETLSSLLQHHWSGDTHGRAGSTLTGHATDPMLEKLLTTPGRAVWRQIKQAAEVANGADGGLTQLANSVQSLHAMVPGMEVHLLGHSAGAIVLGPLVSALQKRRVPLASGHLYAPACTVDFANRYWLPHLGSFDVQRNTFPLYVSVLSDALERRDNVSLGGLLGYQKSLLYLVARSFEENTPSPLFGMEGAWNRHQLFGDWNNAADTLQALSDFDRAIVELKQAGGLMLDPPLTSPYTVTRIQTPPAHLAVAPGPGTPTQADMGVRTAHGSFDCDAVLLQNSIKRIRRGDLFTSDTDLSDVP